MGIVRPKYPDKLERPYLTPEPNYPQAKEDIYVVYLLQSTSQ